MEKVDILRRADIFYDLSSVQLEMLASICEERVVKLGDVIFEENSPGDEMFVIARGVVEILVYWPIREVLPPAERPGGPAFQAHGRCWWVKLL